MLGFVPQSNLLASPEMYKPIRVDLSLSAVDYD
jgi:hypothetical protein